jgi:hypothetical protein
MLSVIGESAVSASLTSHPSVVACTKVLNTEDYDFQQTGWWFNTSRNLKLVPTIEGKIIIPTAAMSVTMSDLSHMNGVEKLRYVQRGGFMWDSYKNTDVISRSLYVDLVLRLPVENLPAAAASYLMHKCGESIFVDEDGDAQKTQKLEQRTVRAWAFLQAAKLKAIKTNALDSPHVLRMLAGLHGSTERGFNRLDGGSA